MLCIELSWPRFLKISGVPGWHRVYYLIAGVERLPHLSSEKRTRMHLIERYRGSLLGLATGDALGTTLEFQKPDSFEPIDDMAGGGPFDLAPAEQLLALRPAS